MHAFVKVIEHKEVVVIIKRSLLTNTQTGATGFLPHKEDYYRDKLSKRKNLINQNTSRPKKNHLQKYWKKRYYLFSKFDRGIKIDEESWYSVTPEPMAKHIAQRVFDTFGPSNVLDAFSGIGGNSIQFARKCGFCVASDIDLQKIEYARHNSELYDCKEQEELQFVHTDFLRLTQQMAVPHFKFPTDRKQGFDCVFISPPWGGVGYQKLNAYTLDHVYPNLNKVMKKALEFSPNLMLFLPKNTSVDSIVEWLLPYHAKLSGEGQLVLEIEQFNYGSDCKALLVCTG